MSLATVTATLRKQFAGIGEVVFSTDAGDELVAANLGSCIAVAAYDLNRRAAGMVHCLLPLSNADPEKAKERPCMYVDTGVSFLLKSMIGEGSKKGDLILCVAGGSQINDEKSVFEIGKRNYQALRKILWKNSMMITAEDVGGDHSRTLVLQVGTGEVLLKAQGETRVLRK